MDFFRGGRKMYIKGVLLDSEAVKYKSVTPLQINCCSHVSLLQKKPIRLLITNRKEFKVLVKYIPLFDKNDNV